MLEKTNKDFAVDLTIAYINAMANNRNADGSVSVASQEQILDFLKETKKTLDNINKI